MTWFHFMLVAAADPGGDAVVEALLGSGIGSGNNGGVANGVMALRLGELGFSPDKNWEQSTKRVNAADFQVYDPNSGEMVVNGLLPGSGTGLMAQNQSIGSMGGTAILGMTAGPVTVVPQPIHMGPVHANNIREATTTARTRERMATTRSVIADEMLPLTTLQSTGGGLGGPMMGMGGLAGVVGGGGVVGGHLGPSSGKQQRRVIGRIGGGMKSSGASLASQSQRQAPFFTRSEPADPLSSAPNSLYLMSSSGPESSEASDPNAKAAHDSPPVNPSDAESNCFLGDAAGGGGSGGAGGSGEEESSAGRRAVETTGGPSSAERISVPSDLTDVNASPNTCSNVMGGQGTDMPSPKNTPNPALLLSQADRNAGLVPLPNGQLPTRSQEREQARVAKNARMMQQVAPMVQKQTLVTTGACSAAQQPSANVADNTSGSSLLNQREPYSTPEVDLAGLTSEKVLK